jgi:hypothetical protein
MKDLVARVQRELPDTDKNRYDVAYERGRAQARSSLLFGGLLLGSAVGAGLMWLLDPTRGAERRADLATRAESLKREVVRATGREEGADERGGRSLGDLGAGFGQTAYDPAAPGATVEDPIRPDEVAEYGASGPVAGAARTWQEDDEQRA